MTPEDLIRLCEARLANLSQLKRSAEQIGDVPRVAALEVEIAQTEATLASLKGLGTTP